MIVTQLTLVREERRFDQDGWMFIRTWYRTEFGKLVFIDSE